MLLSVAVALRLTALSFQGSRDNATRAGKKVGKSEPATGDSARRQLLASGVTFHVFSASLTAPGGPSGWGARRKTRS